MTSSWYDPSDPRFRRTLNSITTNLESANESAQVGIFSFLEHYLKPCFISIGNSVEPCWTSCVDTVQPCVGQCFPHTRNDRWGTGRRRAGTRGRLEHSFDFYDDWEEDERDALLALDDDEFGRVVGSGDQGDTADASAIQPGKRRIFDYGAAGIARRHAGVENHDPTAIPNSSYFGFLTNLPFKVGRNSLNYKPSAADLRDVAGTGQSRNDIDDDILEGDEEVATSLLGGRMRSATVGSGHTTDSFSSRGDLFPSDEEADAVALDDEFTVALTRRASADDASSGRAKTGKRPSNSRRSTRRTLRSTSSKTSKTSSDTPLDEVEIPLPTFEDIKKEDVQARIDEEAKVEKKREAAQKLAKELGLSSEEVILYPQSAGQLNNADLTEDIDHDAAVTSPESIDELGELDAREDEAENPHVTSRLSKDAPEDAG